MLALPLRYDPAFTQSMGAKGRAPCRRENRKQFCTVAKNLCLLFLFLFIFIFYFFKVPTNNSFFSLESFEGTGCPCLESS